MLADYSHTDRRQLWEVLSRPLGDPGAAFAFLARQRLQPAYAKRKLFVLLVRAAASTPVPNGELPGRFFALRTYARTDRHILWKVLSRGIARLGDALFQAEFEQGQAKGSWAVKQQFFVAELVEPEASVGLAPSS